MVFNVVMLGAIEAAAKISAAAFLAAGGISGILSLSNSHNGLPNRPNKSTSIVGGHRRRNRFAFTQS